LTVKGRERFRKSSDMTHLRQTTFTAAAAGLFVLGVLAASGHAGTDTGTAPRPRRKGLRAPPPETTPSVRSASTFPKKH
jgi:hypothetical protein